MVEVEEINETKFSDLNDDVLSVICGHLQAPDLVRFSQCCHQIRRVSTHESLWKPLLKKDWTSTSRPAVSYSEYVDRAKKYSEWRRTMQMARRNLFRGFSIVNHCIRNPRSCTPPLSLFQSDMDNIGILRQSCMAAARCCIIHMAFLPLLLTFVVRSPVVNAFLAVMWLLNLLFAVVPFLARCSVLWACTRLVSFISVWISVSSMGPAYTRNYYGSALLFMYACTIGIAYHTQRILRDHWPLSSFTQTSSGGLITRAGRRLLRFIALSFTRYAMVSDVSCVAAAVVMGLGGRVLLAELLYVSEIVLLVLAVFLGRWIDALRFVIDMATGHLPFRLPTSALPIALLRIAIVGGIPCTAVLYHLHRKRKDAVQPRFQVCLSAAVLFGYYLSIAILLAVSGLSLLDNISRQTLFLR